MSEDSDSGESGDTAAQPVVASVPAGRGPRRRRRVPGGRPHQVNSVFTSEEFAVVCARAAGLRMTVPHYLAHVALAGGRDNARVVEQHQLVLHQLVMMTAQVRRVGQNVNQVLRLLQGTGEVARQAGSTLAATERTMLALEAQAAQWVPSGSVDDVPRYRW